MRAANRACGKKNRAKWRENESADRREKRRSANKAYRAKHRERLLAADRKRVIEKRSERAAYMRAYNKRPDVRARTLQWYRDNRERLYAKRRQWVIEHRDQMRALERLNRRVRRARMRSSPALDRALWADVFARAEGRCQACGIDTPAELRGGKEPNSPTLDHIVPLSQGGAHALENCQCLCRSCNNLKGRKSVPEFLAILMQFESSEPR